tara:strand:+ start:1099 stop:1449 length:351 start_codon:yes stop_codon:yes gene_type:complete
MSPDPFNEMKQAKRIDDEIELGNQVYINGVQYKPVIDSMITPMTFGQLIKHTRKNLGLTLERLAKMAGCSKSFLWSIENSGTEPGRLVLRNIMKATGIDGNLLLEALPNGDKETES